MMDDGQPSDSKLEAVVGERDESANPYSAPTTPPEDVLIDRAALKSKSSVQAQDFLRVAMAMKAFGVFLLLPTAILLFALPLVGLAFLTLPLAFIGIGLGLDAFKSWAWAAAVLLVVPFALLGACVAIALGIRLDGDIGLIRWYALVLPAAAGYIAWTLLSHSGRDRYRSVIEAKRRQAARPKWTPSADELFAEPIREATPEQMPSEQIGSD